MNCSEYEGNSRSNIPLDESMNGMQRFNHIGRYWRVFFGNLVCGSGMPVTGSGWHSRPRLLRLWCLCEGLQVSDACPHSLAFLDRLERL